jgi:anti-anti-sigma factor
MDIFTSRRDGHLHLIIVRGDVDLATAGEFLLRLQLLATPASGVVTLDLSQVTFMNGAGLRALIAFDELVRATGAGVHVVAVSLPVARLLELAAGDGDPECVPTRRDVHCVPRIAALAADATPPMRHPVSQDTGR